MCPFFQLAAKWNGLREFRTSSERFSLVMYILRPIFQFLVKWNGLREFGASTNRFFLVMYV